MTSGKDADESAKGFKKRSHRPWNNLLETAIQEAESGSAPPMPEVTMDDPPSTSTTSNLGGNTTINAIDNYLRENATKDDKNTLEPITLTSLPMATEIETQNKIQQTQKQKDNLIREISQNKQSSMLIGGFLHPSCISGNKNDSANNKMTQLMNDLKNREHELSTLTNNLRISQAEERAEKAELSREMESKARTSAEERMRQAIDQAHRAAEQFQIAMEKARLTEVAQQEEMRLRKTAESKIRESEIKANTANVALRAEQEARRVAEEKAQHALNQTVQTELARQELEKEKAEIRNQTQNLLDELKKADIALKAEQAARIDAEHKMQAMIEDRAKQEQELLDDKVAFQQEVGKEKQALLDKITELQQKCDRQQDEVKTARRRFDELNLRTTTAEERMQEALNHKARLEKIINSEKKIRTIAEQKTKEALSRAAQAELARKAEEKQRRIIDERAKRALAHASKTVMHFLNAPVDTDIDLDEQIKKLNEI